MQIYSFSLFQYASNHNQFDTMYCRVLIFTEFWYAHVIKTDGNILKFEKVCSGAPAGRFGKLLLIRDVRILIKVLVIF